MNKYELMVVISGKSTPAKQKSAVEKVSSFITQLKGKIDNVEEWGKVELMYTIEGNDSGTFILFNIELNSLEVKKVSDKLKAEEEIIRFLIIKK